jgi:thiol-disulfide isomerase/thioredoxin
MSQFTQRLRSVSCMLTCILAVEFAAIQSTWGQETSEPTLKIGDQAPPLKEVKWLKGEPIDGLVKGQVHVIDFWATWCGPCIQAMPHLDELQEKHKQQGLVVVAITSADENNPVDQIKQFVEGRGKDFGFRFAMCETEAMNKAYMEAAQQQAIPCSFVIDQNGKLAFIGLPSDVDIVLEKLYNGTWKGQESIDELKGIEAKIAELSNLLESAPEKVLADLAAIEESYPHVSKSAQFAFTRLAAMLKVGKEEDIQSYFGEVVAKLTKNKDGTQLVSLAGLILNPEINPKKICLEQAEAAIETAIQFDPKRIDTLVVAAFSYASGGQAEKGNTLIERAIAATDDETGKAQLRQLKATLDAFNARRIPAQGTP